MTHIDGDNLFLSGHATSLPLAAVLAACIFLVDTLSSLEFAVASLYVVVVLVGARDLDRQGVIITAAGCILLTILSYCLVHGSKADKSAPLRSVVSLVAIMITTLLVLRSLRSECAAQSR